MFGFHFSPSDFFFFWWCGFAREILLNVSSASAAHVSPPTHHQSRLCFTHNLSRKQHVHSHTRPLSRHSPPPPTPCGGLGINSTHGFFSPHSRCCTGTDIIVCFISINACKLRHKQLHVSLRPTMRQTEMSSEFSSQDCVIITEGGCGTCAWL